MLDENGCLRTPLKSLVVLTAKTSSLISVASVQSIYSRGAGLDGTNTHLQVDSEQFSSEPQALDFRVLQIIQFIFFGSLTFAVDKWVCSPLNLLDFRLRGNGVDFY